MTVEPGCGPNFDPTKTPRANGFKLGQFLIGGVLESFPGLLTYLGTWIVGFLFIPRVQFYVVLVSPCCLAPLSSYQDLVLFLRVLEAINIISLLKISGHTPLA